MAGGAAKMFEGTTKMRKAIVKIMSGLGVAIVLSACGPDSAEVARISEEQKMSKVQSAAFMACAKSFYRNKPIFQTPEGNMLMTDGVPLEVCACHAQSIVDLFVEDQMKEHVAFAVYMAAEQKKKAKITRAMLKGGVKPPEAVKSLTASLVSCVDTYRAAHPDEAAGMFELLPEKKKKEKKKDEKKDGEKTASAS